MERDTDKRKSRKSKNKIVGKKENMKNGRKNGDRKRKRR